MLIHVTLKLRNYIAHPFWPETNACIEIEKKSGANRQKSDDKRRAALTAECDKQGVSYERYLEMKQMSKRQFYARDGLIHIPRHQIAGAFVETIGGSPKALRGQFTKENFRALVQISDFETDVPEKTGTFGRFVKLEGSNQRSWQENDYIGQYLDTGEPFEARGTLDSQDGSDKTRATIKLLLTKAVCEIGIGAARKMGFGRGVIEAWG